MLPVLPFITPQDYKHFSTSEFLQLEVVSTTIYKFSIMWVTHQVIYWFILKRKFKSRESMKVKTLALLVPGTHLNPLHHVWSSQEWSLILAYVLPKRAPGVIAEMPGVAPKQNKIKEQSFISTWPYCGCWEFISTLDIFAFSFIIFLNQINLSGMLILDFKHCSSALRAPGISWVQNILTQWINHFKNQ